MKRESQEDANPLEEASGSWTQQVYIKASNAEADDLFGAALALSADGSTLAVGAPFEDSAANGVGGDQTNDMVSGSGAVYVFSHTGETWVQQAYVKATDTGIDDRYGFFLALSSDSATLAVGSWLEDSAAVGIGGNQTDDCGSAGPTNCAADSGAVYLY